MNKPLLIKGGIIALPVFLFGGLLWNYLGISGHKTVHYEAGDSSPFIQSLLPDARVGEVSSSPDGKSVALLDEPVYFSVFAPPGNWQTADVSVKFKAGDRAVLELGALKDLFAQAFDFRPLANTVLENLDGRGWTATAAPKLGPLGVVYSSDELLTSTAPLKNSEVATYKVQLPWAPPNNPPKLKKGYEGSKFDYPVQAPQEFFIYKYENGPSELNAEFIDENKVVGADQVTMRVFSQSGEVVAENSMPDDGNTLGDGQMSDARSFPPMPPLLEGLPAGVYRVVLSGASDIWFTSISAPSPYIALKNSLTVSYVYPHCGAVSRAQRACDIALNTNAKAVTIQPLNAEALGPINFGSTSVTLDTVGQKVRLTSVDRDISALVLPMRGAGGKYKITGEGFFSMATGAFFTPEPSGFTNFVAAPDSFKIIAANVPEKKMEGAWRVGSDIFDLNTLAKERGAYKFVLSVPFVNEPGGSVEVHGIDITFHKPSLTFRSFLSSLKSFARELIW